MDKILRIDDDTVIDLSEVEGIERHRNNNNICFFMKSGNMFFHEGIGNYADIVNRWAKLIEGEK